MTGSEEEFRTAVKDWIARKNGKIGRDQITDQTPILEQRIITSVQIMELILFLENLTGSSIDVKKLKKGVFYNIDAISKNFYQKR